MKVVVIGSTGTIGKAVVKALSARHEVIGASRQSRPSVDIENSATIVELFRSIPDIEAVVCCAGRAAFKPLAQMSDADFAFSLRSKLMGQVHVVRAGLPELPDRGSITLTSGELAQKAMPGSAAVSLVNAGIEGFVRAAALEAPRGIRINVVSPPWTDETLKHLHMSSPGSLPAAVVALAYVAAVENREYQGQVIGPSRIS